MAFHDNTRRTEAILSLCSIALFLFLALLVYGAKRTSAPKEAILISTAGAEAFSKTLHVEKGVGERIVQWRVSHGSFAHSEQLFEIPLFPKDQTQNLADTWARTKKDLYTATADTLRRELNVDTTTAQRFADYLVQHAVNPDKDTSSESTPKDLKRVFTHATLLDSLKTRPYLENCIAQEGKTVFTHFWISVLLLLLLLFLFPPLLRSKLSGDGYIVPLTLLLSGMGIILLYSLKDPLRDAMAYENHIKGVLLGCVVMYFSARLRPEARHRLRRYQYVWALAAILLTLGLFLFGSGPQGVRLNLFHFQPVELIKILLILFLASYLSERGNLIADSTPRQKPTAKIKIPFLQSLPAKQDIAPLLVMYGCALALFAVVRDMGPGIVLFGAFLCLMYLLTGRSGFVFMGLGLLLLGAYIAYKYHFGVLPTRVDMWLNPFANSHANGMQLAQGYWGMATGGFEGSGLGLGIPNSIPRGGSDFAFASWAEETGLVGAWFTIILYAIVIWRGLRISLEARSDFDRNLGFGLILLLGIQTLLILGGVTGLLPLSGISLPFLSYGNSALVAHFFTIGILRGIAAGSRGGAASEVHPIIPTTTHRFTFVYVTALLIGVGVWRLGTLQYLYANDYATRSIKTPDADGATRAHINPRLLAVERQIERGTIYDRNNKVLATSRPYQIKEVAPNTEVASRLIASHGRYYPYGSACVHILGYLDGTIGGPTGLEKSYDAELKGFSKYTELLSDYRRQNLPGYHHRVGKDIVLTLDAEYQKMAQATLYRIATQQRDKISGKKKDRAAFVLIEPTSGDTIVSVTLPSYDPNGLTSEQLQSYATGEGDEESARLINRAMTGLYPPGSTFKVATTAAALDSKPDLVNFKTACNKVEEKIMWRERGKRYVRRNIHDDKGDHSFGTIALPTAFRVSSNIYFANLATQIGTEAFRSTLREKMHFRSIPDTNAFDADLPDIGYGQGRLLVTPTEMARLAGTVANRGQMMEPRLLLRIVDPKSEPSPNEIPANSLGSAMSVETAEKLQDLMRSVTLSGTARGVFDSFPYEVAGKTGTAQNTRADREPHSWFIGFAPYVANHALPARYAFACVVENGGYGKRVAAVVCKEVLGKVLK